MNFPLSWKKMARSSISLSVFTSKSSPTSFIPNLSPKDNSGKINRCLSLCEVLCLPDPVPVSRAGLERRVVGEAPAREVDVRHGLAPVRGVVQDVHARVGVAELGVGERLRGLKVGVALVLADFLALLPESL